MSSTTNPTNPIQGWTPLPGAIAYDGGPCENLFPGVVVSDLRFHSDVPFGVVGRAARLDSYGYIMPVSQGEELRVPYGKTIFIAPSQSILYPTPASATRVTVPVQLPADKAMWDNSPFSICTDGEWHHSREAAEGGHFIHLHEAVGVSHACGSTWMCPIGLLYLVSASALSLKPVATPEEPTPEEPTTEAPTSEAPTATPATPEAALAMLATPAEQQLASRQEELAVRMALLIELIAKYKAATPAEQQLASSQDELAKLMAQLTELIAKYKAQA